MTQDSELAAVKRKIRALSDKTIENGATEAEAMFAMKKVGELLLQYNLSMDEVTLREQKCITGRFETGSKHLGILSYIHYGIHRLCDVRVWYERTKEGIVFNIFGLEPDVDMAIYLSTVISVAAEVSFREFKYSPVYTNFPKHKKIAANNFKIGFGERINLRLIELAREKKQKEQQAAKYHAEQMKDRMVGASDSAIAEAARQKTGTELITVSKAKMIEEEFKKKGPKLRTVRSYSNSRFDGNSRAAGNSAANNVNLSRPMNNNSGSVKGFLK